MRVMAFFSTSFFAKCLRVGEGGPGRGHLSHTDTFLVFFLFLLLVVVGGGGGVVKRGMCVYLGNIYRYLSVKCHHTCNRRNTSKSHLLKF